MTKLKEYSLEIYRADKRIKKDERYGRNKAGQRFIEVLDFAPSTRDYIDTVVAAKRKQGFIVEVFETFVVQKNFLNGVEFKERYDTPNYCSPSSEAYYSM